jgi:hypothetical protein
MAEQHGMWPTYDERAFGYRPGQWKEWKRQWQEAGAWLGDNRGSMTEEAREEWHARQDERVERAKAAKAQGLVTTSQSETLHDRFYGIINASREVLTDEQEELLSKYSQWLSVVEYPLEITGV